jgi:hypothetical protein
MYFGQIHAFVSRYVLLTNMVRIPVCLRFADTGRMLLTICGMFVLALDRSWYCTCFAEADAARNSTKIVHSDWGTARPRSEK